MKPRLRGTEAERRHAAGLREAYRRSTAARAVLRRILADAERALFAGDIGEYNNQRAAASRFQQRNHIG